MSRLPMAMPQMEFELHKCCRLKVWLQEKGQLYVQLQPESWATQCSWRQRNQRSLRLLWVSVPLRQMQSDCHLQQRFEKRCFF